jgi:hypothetical protein
MKLKKLFEYIPSTDNISEEYGFYQSFHQGSTSEATNKGLPPEVIDAKVSHGRSLKTFSLYERTFYRY